MYEHAYTLYTYHNYVYTDTVTTRVLKNTYSVHLNYFRQSWGLITDITNLTKAKLNYNRGVVSL